VRAVRVIEGVVTTVEVPPPTGDGVVVDVTAAGICGSDLHMIEAGFAPPVTLGHEISGHTPDGTAVAIEPLMPCGTCERCRAGTYHLCDIAAFTILGIGNEGGMADQLLVPERALVPLPPGLDPADASLVEPIAVAVHGLNLVDYRTDQRVAIIGAGSVGLCALAAVVARGGTADVVARHDHQREAVERIGGSTTPTGGYDVVIDTAGTADALATAADLAAPGAAIVLLGMHWAPTPTPGLGLWIKEVRLVPSMTYAMGPAGREMDEAAELLGRRPEVADHIITHRFPLEAAAEAFSVAADRAAGSIKVVLQPS
jgi:threonine dehydrogenase-like Zn-dependent dehydrogenase